MYNKDEVGWLLQLKLPFFIASVDKSVSKIRFYSCRRMYDAFALDKNRESMTLIMASEETFKTYDFIDKDNNDVFIGPPVIEWSVNDLMQNEHEVRKSFYEIIKEHIRIIHHSMELSEIGCGCTYVWKTNEMPELVGWKACNSSDIDFEKLSEKTLTYLCKTLDLWLQLENSDIIDDIESIICDYKKMYNLLKNGFSPMNTE
jgi:hypothetical protein